ncbi:5-methyltetrahydropteroyltriglutamate--homocysteine S-methyltransferase [Nocardioides sp. URHA0032]|uniref:5-methyltetrahydropteroyltriglutamate-- homocysteine S-methyltransferase n=1 Tax=Nocardioides sp. URHA0032 TaxID=1380388 RepID=UPI00048DA491|nr:5-methyltetrahydropteroyltriglutamate--homocysteine S-methyltransferase [Nocardioides sp. URHA0032]
MLRDTPPFRADHVGSLLRPRHLLRAREDHAAGTIDADRLRAIEDEAIVEVIELQRAAGLRSATDGEFRRGSWHMDFIYSLDGVSKAQDNLTVHFKNAAGEIDFTPAALRVDGKLGVSETIFGDAFTFLRDHVAEGVTPKLTIPSPSMVHYRGGAAAIDPAVYPGIEDFWIDLTAAYREQVRRVHDLGCTYLQLDDTSLAYLNDPEQRRAMADRGEDSEHLHEAYIRHLNEALDGRPEGLTVTTHMCRGNFRDSWVAEGGYDFVAEALFTQLGVDGFFLEYDDERSGSFEPLRHVPAGKLVVLGIVTTKHGELESRDVLRRRLDEAAQYVDLEQVCISPQCGFSSTSEGNSLSVDQERAKLALLVELADEVWG